LKGAKLRIFTLFIKRDVYNKKNCLQYSRTTPETKLPALEVLNVICCHPVKSINCERWVYDYISYNEWRQASASRGVKVDGHREAFVGNLSRSYVSEDFR